MATFTQLASGNWRAQVRRKGRYVAETFRRRKDAEEWALDTERCIDRGVSVRPRVREKIRTLGDLINLHIEDMKDVRKPPRRPKAADMEALKVSLGGVKIPDLTRERLIEYGKRRAKQGAGPTTLSIDFSFIRTILSHCAAVHGIETSGEDVRLARIALSRLGLIGKGFERDVGQLKTRSTNSSSISREIRVRSSPRSGACPSIIFQELPCLNAQAPGDTSNIVA